MVKPDTARSEVAGYEARIFGSGEIQTRIANWHDFFNSLVWFTYPATKSALNCRHYNQKQRTDIEAVTAWNCGRRTSTQDTLSLFDEGGILVLCSAKAAEKLSDRLRATAKAGSFDEDALADVGRVEFRVFGHALFELIASKPLNELHHLGGLGLVLPMNDDGDDEWSQSHIDKKLSTYVASEDHLTQPSLYPTIPLRIAL
jgi:hypothetical protein